MATTAGIDQVRLAYESVLTIAKETDRPLPANGSDLLRRNLDCAVIETLHQIREEHSDPPFDSVRGVFVEGRPLYPTSGFHAKTHVQVCIRDLARIKGVFRVPKRFLA